MKIFITGGAGFIGSALTRKLLTLGHKITVYDNFSPQIHGDITSLPDDIKDQVVCIKGDVCDKDLLSKSITNQEALIHLAAETGTGQSMYDVSRYERVNIGGTANLIDILVNTKHEIRTIVLASSRAVYGEGKYTCPVCGFFFPELRDEAKLHRGEYNPICPTCSHIGTPIATDEYSMIHPTSYYGLTKQVQEQKIILFSKLLKIPSVSLRFQNVYGPGQSLKNPYTGMLAVFSNLARQNKTIEIFEDGKESRDFVYIDDVVESIVRSIDLHPNTPQILNIGSGVATTVLDVAHEVCNYFDSKSEIKITGAYRIGDIRHNFADISKAKDVLDWSPTVDFPVGLRNFLTWAHTQEASSGYGNSLAELAEHKLFISTKQ